MKNIFTLFGFVAGFSVFSAGMAVSSINAADQARALTAGANNSYSNYASSGLRGHQQSAATYKTNQKNTYFMVTQPDVDTACREKIYACLADYCGDVTVVPGQRESRCAYATESELYNYALLCLQKDTSVLLPQYTNGTGASNTAAILCPSYVQQELLTYLSMANMADKLTKSNSSLCVERRMELEAAMACHSVAISYGNETNSMMTTYLMDYCGSGVPGGSAEMVSRFANAGNVGANIWGWAEKMVNLDLNKKGADWQAAVDSVLASYTNRMNLACGENLQINTVSQGVGSGSNSPSSLQTVAALAIGTAFPSASSNAPNPNQGHSIWFDVQSATDVYDFGTAQQVVQAGLTNSAITQNSFLSTSQMDSMQTAYKLGTKVFILRDTSRCYVIQVGDLTNTEKSMIAQSFANCVSR